MTANPGMFQHPDLEGPQGSTPEQRLLAGKYKTVEELERGYQNLLTVENQNNERLTMLEQRMLNSDPADRILPSERRAERKRPEEVFEELGIPTDALEDFVAQRLGAALNPLIQGSQAREELRRSYQDFESLETKVTEYLNRNPQEKARYQKLFQADQGGAMEWAINRYLRTAGPSAVPREPGPGDEVNNRLDAMLPGSSTPGGRGEDLAQVQRSERLQKAYDYGNQTGDWGPYTNLRLNEVIPDSHVQGR